MSVTLTKSSDGMGKREFSVDRKAVHPRAMMLTKTTRKLMGIRKKLISCTAGQTFKHAFSTSK